MTILTETFEGWPGGMNLAYPAQELDDTEARYIQDGLVDKPGILRRRGPVVKPAGLPTFSNRGTGIVSTLNPLGQFIVGVLNGDNASGVLSALSNDYTSKVDLTWPFKLPNTPPTNPYYFYDAKPGLTGGTLIGVSSAYDANSPDQGVAYWRGGNKANYTTGTLTVARGSTAVTGSGTLWTANAAPGMFLFANTDDPYTSAYVGIVLSVNSNTSITLGAASPYAATAKTYTLQSLRGICPRVVKGRITCDTTSTTVTGATTKFVSQGLATGTWQIMRSSDFSFVGKVSSVQTDTSLTLTTNAAVSCNNEAFVALRVDGDYNIINTANTQKVGFLNAVYAERQWYANLGAQFQKTSRIWFSDPSDPEGIDLAAFDGDFIDIGSTSGAVTPIKALMPAFNSLLIFKEQETFAVYGSSPTTFEVKKLEDDGTVCGMSVVPYGGGVIWAGHEGIHFFDGVQTENLVATKLGDYYKTTIRTYDPSKYRVYGMMIRDHYMLFIENLSPAVPIVKGNVPTTPTAMTFVINMNTRAVSTFANVNIRGALQLPADSGQKVWYLANSTVANICDGNSLFDSTGVDSFACDSSTIGPDFYIESKKYDGGDSARRKFFKKLIFHYLSQTDGLYLDVVTGLNNVGTRTNNNIPATNYTWDQLAALFATWDLLAQQFPTWDSINQSVFTAKRATLFKKSTHLAFRFYQKSANNTNVVLGPYKLGYQMQSEWRTSGNPS